MVAAAKEIVSIREEKRDAQRDEEILESEQNVTAVVVCYRLLYLILLTLTIDNHNESGSRSRDFIYGPSSDNHANKPTHTVIIKGLSAQTTENAVDYTHAAI